MERGTCATCAFFWTGGPRFQCRARPPVPIHLNEVKGVVGQWPTVDSNDWCGLYTDGRVNGVLKTYNHLINDGDIKFLTSTEVQTGELGT